MPPPGHGDKPGGSWSWVAPAGAGSPDPALSSPGSPSGLDPLSRRLLQIAGVLSGILILLVAYAWSRDDGEYSLNPIAEAAARTQQADGMRAEISAVYTAPSLPEPLAMQGEGAYNGRTGRSQVTLTVPTPAGEVTMEGVGSDAVVYLRSRLLQPGLPPGDEWMAIEPGLGRSAETSFASSSDPGALLKLLRAAGDVQAIGTEEIDGAETVHYRGSFDLRGYADFLRRRGSTAGARQYDRLAEAVPGSTEVEAWIDAGKLVRRLRLTMDMEDAATGRPGSMEMTQDFSDFGIDPDVHLPRPGVVFDATPLALAELGLLDGSNEMPPLASTASSLSPEAFNAKAQKICADVEGQLEHLGERGKPLVGDMKDAIAQNGLEARSTLEAVRRAIDGFYEPSAQAFANALYNLAQIAPPAEKAAVFHRLLRLSSVQLEVLVAVNRAMQVGAYSLSKDLSDRLDRLGHRTDRLAERLGLDKCDSGDSGSGGQPA